jgi:hypothetical protein
MKIQRVFFVDKQCVHHFVPDVFSKTVPMVMLVNTTVHAIAQLVMSQPVSLQRAV